jgi:prolyl-tRNA synthetase
VLAPNYSANLEIATADPQPVPALPDGISGELHTPGQTTIEAVAGGLGVAPGNLLKAFPVVTEDGRMLMVVVRGDHRVNETKLTNTLGVPFRPAREDEIAERIGPAGYIGPVGAQIPVLLDEAVQGEGGWICGANEPDHHLAGVQPGRDFAFEPVDVRSVEAGDLVGGHPITIEPAIEIGNIFQLGTRDSEPLGATYLDESGREQLVWMGSYGIGPARIVAAAVEQYADEKGISWPRSLAPWDVEVVGLGKPGSDEMAAAEALHAELKAAGLHALLDDRDAGTGEKFADAELLGVPLRITVGKRSLAAGSAEAQARRGLQNIEGGVPLTGGAQAVRELWAELP